MPASELSDQLELSKSELIAYIRQAFTAVTDFSGIGDLSDPGFQEAAAEAEEFIVFLKDRETTRVHSYALKKAANGVPALGMFRIYETLRHFCQNLADKELIPSANAVIDAYCTAYAEGYAEGRATWIETARLPITEYSPLAMQMDDRWLTVLFELSQVLGSILNLGEMLTEAVDLIRKCSGCSAVSLFLVDDLFSWATVQVHSSEHASMSYPADFRVKVGDSSLVGQCIVSGTEQEILDRGNASTVLNQDILSDIRSIIVLPLKTHGQVIGAVSFQRKQDVVFDANEKLWLRLTIDQIANAIQNARLYSELTAYADTLENLVQERTAEILRAKDYTEAILNNSPDATLFVKMDRTIKTVNNAFCQMFGYSSDEVNSIVVADLASLEYKNVVESMFLSVVETGQVVRFRMIARRKDSGTFDLDAAFAPNVENSSVVGVVCNLRDVTDLVRADGLIKASLREKEVLLKEIHHRVKNNLQIVASLINLQTMRIVDDSASRALHESQSRIRTIALIHERLYQSEDLASVDFANYVQELVSYIASSYQSTSRRIKVILNLDDIVLDLDTAIPCGLIINELISNAFKHAFVSMSEGEISVEMHAEENNQHMLAVRDNGIGLPPGFDLRSTSSLGLQLVQGLVSQLHGTFEILQQMNVTSWVICFPAPGLGSAKKQGYTRSTAKEEDNSKHLSPGTVNL